MRRDEPHWLLTDTDAKVYGQALQNALRHIPIGVAQKTVDFSALFICALNFEVPRIYASRLNQKARRAQRPGATPGNGASRAFTGAEVFQFRQPPAGGPSAAPSTPAPAEQPAGGGVEGFTGDGVDSTIGGP